MIVVSVTGDRLRFLREKIKLTQEELAEKIGIKRDRYAKYETGENPVPGNLIVKLSDLFQVPTDYLLGKSDDPKLKQVIDPETLKEFEDVLKSLDEISGRLYKIMERSFIKQENSPTQL